ncbi:ComEA family DNA-binding protein [Labedella phragmitis]|uniref:ComEA family DNA-binding protein n=1 Tax=Labedella phragmitis TaxID=2498849 RepID=A0A444PW29_9MICO|nr:ComEA family DNA-binding protein [Labedella phragmitis]
MRIGAAAAVVLVLAVLGIAAASAAVRSASSSGAATIPLGDAPPTGFSTSATDAAVEAGTSDIYVHVLGAVAEPGLYSVPSDARVVDAVAAAGGFSDAANPASVNLARTMTDGEQLVVLEKGQTPVDPGGAVAPTGTGGGAAAVAPGTPLSLNTATTEQLESLPRIGPALAERIVAWRTDNGPFRLVDELLDVPGIGDAILAGLDGLVTT